MRLSLHLMAFAVLAAALCADTARAQSAGATVEGVEVPTPRGVKLVANLHAPKTPNGVAVVLAPGQGYSRDKPLMVRCAEQLADAGFTALRFDWAYFTAKGQPAEGYGPEIEDAEAAMALVRARPGVTKVVLAGKSLGSLVTVQVAGKKHANLAGAGLLTLPVHVPGAPDQPWCQVSDLAKIACPVVIVNGDMDEMSELHALYKLAAAVERAPRVVVVPGMHSFETKPKEHATAAPSIELAAQALVRWARRFCE